MGQPVQFRWTNGTMVPRHQGIADKQYAEGGDYVLIEWEHRSSATHNHYFASLHDAWANLGEDAAERFPTPEHLRKWALIRAGYRDERSIVCASKAEAQRVAGFVRPLDGYAVVTVREALVTIYTAQSQSMKAMGRKVFQESKQAVLDIVAGMIGVAPDQLGKAS